MSEEKVCSLPGCGKKLRAMNKKGVCGSGCLSPEAPPYRRAGAVEAAAEPRAARRAPVERPKATGATALERFRIVSEALGQDADALLEAFAAEWLNEVRTKLEE